MATFPAAIAEPLGRPEPVAAGRAPGGPGGGRRFLTIALFMGPAAVLLGFIVAYPTVATAVRSFYDQSGDNFVGTDNYRTLFGTTSTLVAIRNNAIWIIVFPFLVTFIGLVFAVLTERIRWATAFKTVVFAPMAIALFASGVIWRIVYETDPSRGVINSGIATVVNAVHPPGLYTGPNVKAISGLTSGPDQSLISTASPSPGDAVKLGLTGILPSDIPPGALPAQEPQGAPGAITGIVWRDFSPGGHVGAVDPGELGLPGMRLTLQKSDGSSVGSTTSDSTGAFRFDNVSPASYHVSIDGSNFRTGFAGVNWLGPQSLTPTSSLGETGQSLLSIPLVVLAEIFAMLWIWSGFAMVVIGAGLAALNREVLEASKMDGATEWQTFRHVTFPLLRPVLIVVFITMFINVLKIFDIILAIAPDSSQQQSNVIALEMWRVGFTGLGDKGLSSAVAVFLFLLVVPVMLINVRRIRG
jgi:alpha-glucoside transport system permease protein